MNRRGVGAVFCLMAAMFFCTWNLSAAVFMSSITSWDMGLFAAGLEYTGLFLPVMGILSLVIGIGWLVFAEVIEQKEKK